MADTNLTSQLAAAEALMAQAIADACSKLRALPGNPATTPVGNGSVKAFTVSSSSVFGSPGLRMDAFFHHWQSQYEAVAKLLEKRNFARVRELLEGKTVEVPGQGRTSLAPQVIENIKAVTGDLLLQVQPEQAKAA